jgi:purine nucleosidase
LGPRATACSTSSTASTASATVWREHDPCVVAWLLRPELFRGKECAVEIETEGCSLGRTNVHWWPRERRKPNALVINEVDVEGFFDLLFDRLARL